MNRSDRYRSNDPILSTRVFDSSGPRSTLRFLRITLIIACCIVLFACVALIAAGVNNMQMANATDEQALARSWNTIARKISSIWMPIFKVEILRRPALSANMPTEGMERPS